MDKFGHIYAWWEPEARDWSRTEMQTSGELQAWGCWQMTFGTGCGIARAPTAFCQLVLLTTVSLSSGEGSAVLGIPHNRWAHVQGCARQGAELWI